MPDLSLVPDVPDDPSCVCGYRQSQHGQVAAACKSFNRSAFLTQAALDMAKVEKYVGSKLLLDGRRRR